MAAEDSGFGGESQLVMVLGDDDRGSRKKGRAAEKLEDAFVFIRGGVGRIEKNNVEGGRGGNAVALRELFEAEEGVAGKNPKSLDDCEGRKVFANQFDGRIVLFEEDDFLRAAAECFDADGAGSREDVQEARAFDHRAEDVEESFAEAVAGGPEFASPERFDLAAAELSGDDAHDSTYVSKMIAALPVRGQLAEDGVERRRLRDVIREGKGFAAGGFEEFAIAQRIGNVKAERARLARAEEFAGAAELQVGLVNFEAVRSADHSIQAGAGFVGHARGRDKDAVGFRGAAADASAQLVKLRKAETLGMLDDHHGGAG